MTEGATVKEERNLISLFSPQSAENKFKLSATFRINHYAFQKTVHHSFTSAFISIGSFKLSNAALSLQL